MAVFIFVTARTTAEAGKVLVLESYAGERPKNASSLLKAIYSDLQRRGASMEHADIIRRLDSRLSRSGAVLDPHARTTAETLVDQGFNNYQRGHFRTAHQRLSRAIAMYQRRPATLARHRPALAAYSKALIYLAVTYPQAPRPNEEAAATMAEFIRSFPDEELSFVEHGDQPREIHRRVRADLEPNGRGSIRLDIDDQDVIGFLNGRFLGTGSRTIPNLYPGLHTIYVQKGSRGGRVHRVNVKPKAQSVLTIQWALDQTLRSTDDWVGFEFANEAERSQREAALGAATARELGAKGLIILGIRAVRDPRNMELRRVVGARISLDSGQVYASGALAIEPV